MVRKSSSSLKKTPPKFVVHAVNGQPVHNKILLALPDYERAAGARTRTLDW